MVWFFALEFLFWRQWGRGEGRGKDPAKNVVVTLEDVELLLTSLSDKHLTPMTQAAKPTQRGALMCLTLILASTVAG